MNTDEEYQAMLSWKKRVQTAEAKLAALTSSATAATPAPADAAGVVVARDAAYVAGIKKDYEDALSKLGENQFEPPTLTRLGGLLMRYNDLATAATPAPATAAPGAAGEAAIRAQLERAWSLGVECQANHSGYSYVVLQMGVRGAPRPLDYAPCKEQDVSACMDALRAAGELHKAAPAAPEAGLAGAWRPLDGRTPKDGEAVLVALDDNTVRYIRFEFYRNAPYWGFFNGPGPTHWQPLPAAPARASAELRVAAPAAPEAGPGVGGISVLDAGQIELLRDNADFCNKRTLELLDRLLADYNRLLSLTPASTT